MAAPLLSASGQTANSSGQTKKADALASLHYKCFMHVGELKGVCDVLLLKLPLGFANLGRAWENEEEEEGAFFDSHKVSRTAVITPHFTDEKIEPQGGYWPKATWLTSDGGVDSKSSGCQGYKRIGPSPQIHDSLHPLSQAA